MAVMESGTPIVIPNSEGEQITASVVAIAPGTGKLIAGTPAKRQAVTNPQNTIYSVKRLVGHRFCDPFIQRCIRLVPFKICEAADGGIIVQLDGKEYSPTHIMAALLQKLRRDAETYIREPVKQAVITVPAYFNDLQRQAVKQASCLANLEVLRIINEPTAACIAYGLHRGGDKTLAVYHLGGGTSDISILDIGQGVFEVKTTSGDTQLGGDDFDQRIIKWIFEESQRKYNVGLGQDSTTLQRLKWAAEKAKCELSTVFEAEINLPCITTAEGTYRDFSVILTRVQLERLVSKLIDKTLVPCNRALSDARLTVADIDEVVLVGQQTRMPAVQATTEKFFGRTPCRGIDPAEAVALGAAVQGGVLGGEIEDVLLMDVTPHTLSFETLGGVATTLIERNTTIPYGRSKICTTTADMQTSVDIKIYQGERPMATDNVLLGQIRLDGIPPAPKGIPQIEVAFDIDANGILNVQAKDIATGQEKKVIITPQSTSFLEANWANPKAISDAESVIDEVKTSLSEQGNRLSPHIRSIADSKLSALRLALQDKNVAQISRRTEELDNVRQCIEALRNSDNAWAVELLIKLLMEEDDEQVRVCTRQTLRQIGSARVDEVLRPRTWQEKLLGRRMWVDK
jgi:molecular chaperone DnaK